jgi:hypothetical protein
MPVSGKLCKAPFLQVLTYQLSGWRVVRTEPRQAPIKVVSDNRVIGHKQLRCVPTLDRRQPSLLLR